MLLILGLCLPLSCGPDDKPPEPCDGPDFNVLISAAEGSLPDNTRVVLVYGSGREEFQLNAAVTPEVLFCTMVDRQGQPLEGGAPGHLGGGAAGAGQGGEAGSTAGASSSRAEALRCTLWTQGPATLQITAAGYPDVTEELKLESGKCTVEHSIQLEHERSDAGS